MAGAMHGAHAQATTATVAACRDASLVKAFAPTGTLRASINIGNPVLANLDAQGNQPVGVSVDLAQAFARQLGVPLQLVTAKSAGTSVENVEQDRADIGFFAVDPKRGQAIHFTSPYVLIEGAYAVRNDSPVTRNEQVDQPGVSIAVSKGSAYDLYLSRALHQATIERIAPSAAVFGAFQQRHLDVLAGVKPQLQEEAASAGGLRVLDGRFMVIRQAMGVPKARGKAASACLEQFVDTMRDSGFVDAALKQHHIDGASVAKQGD